jgi:hypothetical protein
LKELFKLALATLARQMYPNYSKFLVEAFEVTTEKPYGYLVLDLKQETNDQFRVWSNIFPDEVPYVYSLQINTANQLTMSQFENKLHSVNMSKKCTYKKRTYKKRSKKCQVKKQKGGFIHALLASGFA